MIMKIGILTFHRAENFGAVLQAYALQFFLCRLGHVVYIVDYRCSFLECMYEILNPSILWSRKNFFRSAKLYFNRLSFVQTLKTKKEKYRQFRDAYLLLSPKVISYPKEQYDAYIVGSDQVWNFGLTGGVNPVYLLDFPMKKSTIKLSYAASSESFICQRIMNGQYKKALRQLNSFDAISVRENELKDALGKYLNKKIDVHIDPTFLLEKSDYEKILIRPAETNYILVYHLHESIEGTKIAENLSQDTGKKIIEIHASVTRRKDDNQKYDLGPLEILGYIYGADTIITTSFHGLALSLIMEKDVWVINKGQNTRQKNLLNLLGINNRLILSYSELVKNNKTIDYSMVRSVVNKEINKSYFYFQEHLQL